MLLVWRIVWDSSSSEIHSEPSLALIRCSHWTKSLHDSSKNMERQEILIRWPSAWLSTTTVLQGSYSHNSVKAILKAEGSSIWKDNSQNGEKKEFIILLPFFSHPLSITKNLVELVIWQCMLGLKTFLSFAKLPKNSLSSGEGHLDISHVHSKHGMFRECNCLLTWRSQLQGDKECGIILLAKLWACSCFVYVTISPFKTWHHVAVSGEIRYLAKIQWNYIRPKKSIVFPFAN